MEVKVKIEEGSPKLGIIPYPTFDKKKLWLMSSEEFNDWRRKYDFPRIVAFLQEELEGFIQWQKEQKITTDQLIIEGISGFILEQQDYHLSILNKQTQDLKKPHKHFIPYFTWARKKKIKPPALRADSFSWTPSTKTNEVYLLKKLRLLDLGGLELKGLSIGEGSRTSKGNKKFEFTCLDNTTFENCYHAPEILNFSSARNIKIKDCSFHHLSAFSTDFTGITIEKCSLQAWTLNKCRLSGYKGNSRIVESEIKYWKFFHTNFFDFFSSIKIFDSAFTFENKDYLQYKNVKNAYTAQGDKAESGYYYYLERRAHFNSKINYFIYNRWKLPFGTTKDGYSKFFSGVKYKFKNKEFTFFSACYDFLRFVNFRLSIVFSRKFFLDVVKHYFLLFFDYVDRMVRGYGEKPFRIIFTALIMLNIYTLIDYFFYENDKNYLSVVYHNLLVFIGQGEFEDLSTPLLALRISQTLLGLLFISLFIADFSSKHRY